MTTQLKWPDHRGRFIDTPEEGDRVGERRVVDPGDVIEVDDDVAEHYRDRGFEDVDVEPKGEPEAESEPEEPKEPDAKPDDGGPDGDGEGDPDGSGGSEQEEEPSDDDETPGDDTDSEPPFDPADHSVDELADALADVDDMDALLAIREAEVEGENRKTGVEAIDRRINSVGA